MVKNCYLQACYDIREAAAFWGLQCAVAQTQKDRAQVPEFFSTHPTHETRVAQLQALIPEVRVIHILLLCMTKRGCAMFSLIFNFCLLPRIRA